MTTRATESADIEVMRPDHHGSSLVVSIVEAIAEARDVEVESMEPLARHVDPDALERVIDRTTVTTRISLELYGCIVDIDADGNVDVRLLDRRANRRPLDPESNC